MWLSREFSAFLPAQQLSLCEQRNINHGKSDIEQISSAVRLMFVNILIQITLIRFILFFRLFLLSHRVLCCVSHSSKLSSTSQIKQHLKQIHKTSSEMVCGDGEVVCCSISKVRVSHTIHKMRMKFYEK